MKRRRTTMRKRGKGMEKARSCRKEDKQPGGEEARIIEMNASPGHTSYSGEHGGAGISEMADAE